MSQVFRFCRKCDERFNPTGKYNFLCRKCNKRYKNKPFWDNLLKEQKRRRKII